MAAPNILSLSNIAGKSTSVSLGSTTLTDVLVNSSGSNKVLKVNTVRATNTDGAVSHDISVGFSTVGAATTQYLASTIGVPADSALVVVDKTSALYLEENQKLVALASTTSGFDIFVSYEDMS